MDIYGARGYTHDRFTGLYNVSIIFSVDLHEERNRHTSVRLLMVTYHEQPTVNNPFGNTSRHSEGDIYFDVLSLASEEVQDLALRFSHWIGFLWTICINWVMINNGRTSTADRASCLTWHLRDSESSTSRTTAPLLSDLDYSQ